MDWILKKIILENEFTNLNIFTDENECVLAPIEVKILLSRFFNEIKDCNRKRD